MPWVLRFAGDILRKNGSAQTAGGADKEVLLTRTFKGVVSFVSKIFSTQTQREGVRPVQEASRLGAIFQTAGIGTIYGLLFAGLLFAPLLPHLEAQSSRNSYTLQAGDEITEIKIGGVWKTIVDWLKGLFGGAVGTALWDAIKAKWNAQLFTPSSGTIVAYAEVILMYLDGEKIYWYGLSGKPISKIQYGLDDPFGMPMKLREDFQYYDYSYVRMT